MGSSLGKQKGVPTDWNRYLGRWYEQARIPTWFEPSTMSDVTADYVPWNDGSIRVINRGRDTWKQLVESTAKATIDRSRVGTLNVSFFPPFQGDYIVLAHDSDYQIAIVAGSTTRYLWLLTRSPNGIPNQWAYLREAALRNGYTLNDLAQVQATPKTAPMLRAGGAMLFTRKGAMLCTIKRQKNCLRRRQRQRL